MAVTGATIVNPQVIPLTAVPSQTVNITLNDQICAITVYTKSINRPIQPPGDIKVIPIAPAPFTGSLQGNVLSVADIGDGVVGIDYEIFADGDTATLPGGCRIREFLTGVGQDGTYSVYPGTVPVDAAGRYSPGATAPVIAGDMVAYTASGPTYENTNPVFMDLLINDDPVLLGVVLKDESLTLMNGYLGLIGDIAIVDVTGRNEDPFGVPASLPNPPGLRNAWQRSVPLELEGKAPPDLANTIPGLGSRYLLTYWANLK
jgi:hypothetical protein